MRKHTLISAIAITLPMELAWPVVAIAACLAFVALSLQIVLAEQLGICNYFAARCGALIAPAISFAAP